MSIHRKMKGSLVLVFLIAFSIQAVFSGCSMINNFTGPSQDEVISKLQYANIDTEAITFTGREYDEEYKCYRYYYNLEKECENADILYELEVWLGFNDFTDEYEIFDIKSSSLEKNWHISQGTYHHIRNKIIGGGYDYVEFFEFDIKQVDSKTVNISITNTVTNEVIFNKDVTESNETTVAYLKNVGHCFRAKFRIPGFTYDSPSGIETSRNDSDGELLITEDVIEFWYVADSVRSFTLEKK